MGRPVVLLSLGSAALAAAALAAAAVAGAPPSSVKATVKDTSSSSREITIVNGSTQSYPGYFINSTDSPKITAASDKSCKMGTSPWSSNGKSHVDYWANCSASVAAGKTLNVKLTTSGSGTIFVSVKTATAANPHGLQYQIGTGS